MKHIKKRVSKIIDELINYFFHIGSKKMNIDLIEESTLFRIVFQCNIQSVEKSGLDKLIKCLKCEKSIEMEEYYWELTGESDSDTELMIVGMMIDEFELDINDNELKLVIIRYKEE